MCRRRLLVLPGLILSAAVVAAAAESTVTGELRRWHKVTVDLAGPATGEAADPNPFTDYRMDVTFGNGDVTYLVPGYFAADGDAANSSATSGSTWRAHLAPDRTGTWTYTISFRQGRNVAASDDPTAGSAVAPFDGTSDVMRVTVEPFSTRVTKTFRAADDAYLEGSTRHDNGYLKVEPGRRVTYLKFSINGLPDGGEVEEASLRLMQSEDSGNGTLLFHRGSHNDWTESDLSAGDAPTALDEVGRHSGAVTDGETIEVDITPLVEGNGTCTLIVTMADGGNDIWFGSDESSERPELTVTARGPEETGGGQIPGDCTQDGKLDISDAVCLLGHLFLGSPAELPCGSGTLADPGNAALLNFNGSTSEAGPGDRVPTVDLTDAITLLQFLFITGTPHALGTECTPIPGCPERC